jgi:hypothetical protein
MISSAGLEYHIESPEHGAVMLALTILGTAVDDIRLHLSPPESTWGKELVRSNSKHAVRSKGYKHRHRAIHARNAAAFLQNDAQIVCRALEACGVKVPLKKIFHKLKTLKPKEVPAHG